MSDDARLRSSAYGQGVALVLLANFFFSFVDTSTKWLLGAGLVVVQIAFMRYAVHFAITAAQRLIQGKANFALPRRIQGWVLLRSFCLVSATLVNFVVIGQLSLAVTSALLHLSPLFICLFAYVMLGEAITRHHWVAIGLGLLGATIILWPFGERIEWIALLMLYPAAAMALYQVITRKLTQDVRPGVLQFVTGALGTLALAPFVAFNWSPPPSALAWGLLIALGVFAWAGHEALTRAFAHATAGAMAPFGYSFVVFLTISGMLFFGEIPAAHTLMGAALIILAGVYSWRFRD